MVSCSAIYYYSVFKNTTFRTMNTKPTSESIKHQIDKLRDEIDRLSLHGSMADKEAYCTREIGKLQKQLKELYDEEY
jgi:hypothetical protein